jgi:Tol biopolymer transport system component
VKLAVRVLLLATCAVVIGLLSGDSIAGTSDFRPEINRSGSLAFHDGADGSIQFMHVDGTRREFFKTGHSPAWSPDGKKLAYVSGLDVRIVNRDGTDDHLAVLGLEPAWEPNGDLLAQSFSDIVRVPANGGATQNLTNTPTVHERQPAPSQDGMWIAFMSDQDTSAEPDVPTPGLFNNLWLMNTTDLIASQSLRFEGDIALAFGGQPTWAPDSHRIAFSYGGDIWTTPPDGNNPTNLTESDEPSQSFPAWSPDNKLIAYAESAMGTNPDGTPPSQIFTIDPDSRDRENLTNSGTARETMPEWQPWAVQNGRILFGMDGDGDGIGMVDPDGSHLSSIRFITGAVDLDISPDGTQIATVINTFLTFSLMDDSSNFAWGGTAPSARTVSWFPDGDHVVYEDISGDLQDYRGGFPDPTTMALTTTPDVLEAAPAVSPDGSKIYFVSDQLQGSDPPVKGTSLGIWRMDFDGLGREFVLQLGAFDDDVRITLGNAIGWSPDGTKIVYNSGMDVWIADADGGNPQNLTNDAAPQADVSWSPDGGLIAYDQFVNDEWTIWTIDPISAVRNQVPIMTDNNDFLPVWQPMFGAGSDGYFVWGDYNCDGLPTLPGLLQLLKYLADMQVKNTPGCPWIGDPGLTPSYDFDINWGDTNCDNSFNAQDVLDFFAYYLELGQQEQQPAGDSRCPPIGTYLELLPPD